MTMPKLAATLGPCPLGNTYCDGVTTPDRQHVCTGRPYTVPTPARHVFPGAVDAVLAQAMVQDFRCTPVTDNVPNPQVSFSTSGDMLDLHDPADVFDIADGFEKFAEQLRDLGRQLEDLRGAADVQNADATVNAANFAGPQQGPANVATPSVGVANPSFVPGQRAVPASDLADSGLHPTPVGELVAAAGVEVVEVEDSPRALVCAAAIEQDEQSLVMFVPDGQDPYERETGIRMLLAQYLSSADLRKLNPGLSALAAVATVDDFRAITPGGAR